MFKNNEILTLNQINLMKLIGKIVIFKQKIVLLINPINKMMILVLVQKTLVKMIKIFCKKYSKNNFLF